MGFILFVMITSGSFSSVADRGDQSPSTPGSKHAPNTPCANHVDNRVTVAPKTKKIVLNVSGKKFVIYREFLARYVPVYHRTTTVCHHYRFQHSLIL